LWLDGTTYRMWFNGYTYTDGFERIGAAHTEPVPGTWLDVELIYDLFTMKLTVDGVERSADVSVSPGALRFAASGTAELDDVEFHWVGTPEDSAEEPPDSGDTASVDTDGTTDGTESDSPRGDCGCRSGGAPPAASAGLAIAVLALRRRRR
jgi:MYXO-CTERM domain-containing protein